MLIADNLIIHKGNKLHYAVAGAGPDALLLFPGFAQDYKVFHELAVAYSPRYTLYVFDLFLHGKSEWNKGENTLEKKAWAEIIHSFLQEKKIEFFSVAGFSMGARFAMATLEAYPEKLRSVFLIAPDGIRTSFWYRVATFSSPTRYIFKSMILHPGRFRHLANTLKKLRLIDKGLARFAESQMNTGEKRNRVYLSWVVFRNLSFNLQEISELINKHDIKLTVIVGEQDKVVTPGAMNPLVRRLNHPKLIILKTGHHGLLSALIHERLLG